MEIKPLDGPFGAEIIGLNLSQPLDEDNVARVNAAFVEHVVLCFRDQNFSDPETFIYAAEYLGEPMPPVTSTYRLTGYGVIEELTNQATDKRIGDGKPLLKGGSWHTDHSNLEHPPKATVLYAIDVPEEGGNTEFTNLFLAYDALDQRTKDLIRGKRAFHAYLSRRAPRKLLTRTNEEEEGSSGVWQPLVREHPESGRPGLYLNPMRCDDIEGMDETEGDALLDQLYAHCDQEQFRYSHRYRSGDVVIWDNRSSLHQATFDYDPEARRYLHRIMLRGDLPLLAA